MRGLPAAQVGVNFGGIGHSFEGVEEDEVSIGGAGLEQCLGDGHHAAAFPDAAFDDRPGYLVFRNVLYGLAQGGDAGDAGHGERLDELEEADGRLVHVRGVFRLLDRLGG